MYNNRKRPWQSLNLEEEEVSQKTRLWVYGGSVVVSHTTSYYYVGIRLWWICFVNNCKPLRKCQSSYNSDCLIALSHCYFTIKLITYFTSCELKHLPSYYFIGGVHLGRAFCPKPIFLSIISYSLALTDYH